MDLSLFLEGGRVSRKDSLKMSLLARGVGVQGKSDNVTLYHVFFLTASLSLLQSLEPFEKESKI